MKLPHLDDPARYLGLYIFDFGEWVSVGYTAREIAMLLESEQYRTGKVYRMHRVWPDGRMELAGVARERFLMESAMVFWRADRDLADRDFDEIESAARRVPPPCRAYLHLADWQVSGPTGRYAVALLFPAEYEQDMGTWLSAIGCQAGDIAEGGISVATTYHEGEKLICRRKQFWPADTSDARTPESVFANVRRAVQR